MYICSILSLSLYLPFNFTFVSPFVFMRQAQTEYMPALSLSLYSPLLLCLQVFVVWRQAQLCKSAIFSLFFCLFSFVFVFLRRAQLRKSACKRLPASWDGGDTMFPTFPLPSQEARKKEPRFFLTTNKTQFCFEGVNIPQLL